MTTQPDNQKAPSRGLNIGVWVAQVLIFVAFGVSGFMKLTWSIKDLAALFSWTGELPASIVRSLGVIDLAGGIGVLLPALTGIRPQLAWKAALGCMALQVCAAIFHLSRGEAPGLPVNIVLFALSAVIFWGRRKYPTTARGA